MTPTTAPARPLSYWAPHWQPAVFTRADGEVPIPDFRHGEVEIARLVVDALVPELFSLRARRARAGRPYRYELVDSVGTDLALPRAPAGTLSLDEVVALLDGAAAYGLPHPALPFVERLTHATLDAGTLTPKEAAAALRVESAVYASLGSVYAPRIAAAVRAWAASAA
ncbi:MAG: hypothetical protein KJT01_14290 [Gemmatimonadetes bacterium]|nr:hypothetical protein [Gemmatimonadota bacterium]